MKVSLLLATALLVLAGCDRKSAQSDEQRQTEEKRIAELRDLESRAAQREADAQAAQLEADRQRLADDQAALDEEKRKLAAEKSALRDAAAEARYRADEQRLAQRQAALREEQDRAAAARRKAEAAEDARLAKQEAAERKLDFFYDALDPLGDWMEVEPYGYVWQPREARAGDWRPYTDGTWAYTDYGWTWKANEPFGWATYHYGRWARLRNRGWVWVPGSEWAPAWVSWRKSPQYVGWAPLPPEAHSGSGFNSGVDSYYDIGPSSYTFVPAERLGEPTYRGVVVEPARNVTIVNQTVNVTRINYTTIENKTVIVNRGPDLEQINAVSSRPIQRFRLERDSDRSRVGNNSGNSVAGGVLRLLAPAIVSAPRPASAPVKVKERVRSAEFERGWGTGNNPDTQAVRTKFRQEAAQAEDQSRREPASAPPPKVTKPFVSAPAATPAPAASPRRSESNKPSAPVATPVPAATPRPEQPRRPGEDRPRNPGADPQPAATPRPGSPRAERPEAPASETPRGEMSRPDRTAPSSRPGKLDGSATPATQPDASATPKRAFVPPTTPKGRVAPATLPPANAPEIRPESPKPTDFPKGLITPRPLTPPVRERMKERGGPSTAAPVPEAVPSPGTPAAQGRPSTLPPRGAGRGTPAISEPLGTPAGKPRKATPPDGLPDAAPTIPRKGAPNSDNSPEPRKSLTPEKPAGAAGANAPLGDAGLRPAGMGKGGGFRFEAKPGATPDATPRP